MIVSEMEHHSNLLPWREAAKAKVYLAESDVYGRVDVGKLDALLTKLRKQKRWVSYITFLYRQIIPRGVLYWSGHPVG